MAPAHLDQAPLVLVAEDSGTVRKLIVRILERSGFRTIEAPDGLDALTTAVAHHPDVVLLDVDMPGCDGIEVLRRLKELRSLDVEVLMLSASDDIELIERALTLGALDYVRKPCHPAELVARVRRALGVQAEADELRRRSTTDELTGLPNRRGLRQLLDTLSQPVAPWMAVAIVDADHFKRVNDTWGHDVGDLVLRTIAQRLSGAWPTVQVGRWGGEEFLAVFPVSDRDDALVVAERLRLAVAAAPIEPGGCPPLEITVSIGVSAVPNGHDLDAAVARADEGLYEAKEAGRNRVVVAEPARR